IPHSLAELNEDIQPKAPCDTCACISADDRGLDLGQLPLEQLRKLLVEVIADHHPKDRVAQKLQTLIAVELVVCARGMTQGPAQEFTVLELVAEDFLGAV